MTYGSDFNIDQLFMIGLEVMKRTHEDEYEQLIESILEIASLPYMNEVGRASDISELIGSNKKFTESLCAIITAQPSFLSDVRKLRDQA